MAISAVAVLAIGGALALADRADQPDRSGGRAIGSEEPTTTTALDEANCANLGQVPIGDATGAPAAVAARADAFRAMAAAEAERPALVCAEPMAAWRDDLVVQPLWSSGAPDGVLVGGLVDGDPILRLSTMEWTSYQFRAGGGADHNFLGIPLERERVGSYEVIHTSDGALVMEEPSSWGNVVVAGAYDFWMARGGPTGEMGIPMGKPTGTLELGAHQDFANGYVLLRDVRTDLEAEMAPASAYEWFPTDADSRDPAGPGSIVQVTGTSYYVDPDGVRHWIDSVETWSCAVDTLGVREHEVRGWEIARFTVGAALVCPGDRPGG